MGKRSRAKRAEPEAPERRARRPAFAGRVHAPRLLQPLLLVGLVAVVVYLNGIPGDFVFDDKLIQRDPRIRGETSFWTIFVTDYWYRYVGTSADLYRPLTIASYALNFAVAGLSSPAFHAVNILLHALFCVLLVALVEALFRDRSLAVVSGLLFATHPIHTEAVTGIVGRAEVLSALFLLAALYLHGRRYAIRAWGPRFWLPVALGAYLCALLSKETAIVGPGLVLLVEYLHWAGGPAGSRGVKLRRALAAVGPYLGVVVAYLAIRFLVLGQFIQKAPPRSYLLLFGQPLATRVFTAFEIFAIYLWRLLFPATLSADYSYRQVPLVDSLASLPALLGGLAAAVLAVALLWAVRRQVWPAVFALGFFAVSYAVVSNLIVPIGVLVAERLMYLPSVGFCVGLAWVGLALSRRYEAAFSRPGLRRAPAGILALVVLLYSGRTVVRNLDWRNNETLYAATVKASPECHAAHFNYAAVLMRQGPGRNELALQHLRRAYEIRQDHYPSLVNLSSLYLELGQPDQARRIALQGLQVRPEGRELRGLLEAAEAQLRQREQG